MARKVHKMLTVRGASSERPVFQHFCTKEALNPPHLSGIFNDNVFIDGMKIDSMVFSGFLWPGCGEFKSHQRLSPCAKPSLLTCCMRESTCTSAALFLIKARNL